jgi:hypothetical protein
VRTSVWMVRSHRSTEDDRTASVAGFLPIP